MPRYPKYKGWHYIEDGGQTLSMEEAAQLARAYGLPGKGFAQIFKGESGLHPFVKQHDPGDGMVGYGLGQLTPNAWGQGTAAMDYFNKLGGIKGMRDLDNQMKMIRFLYKSAGNSFSPWYGTRFLTDRSEEGKLNPIDRSLISKGVVTGQPQTGGVPDNSRVFEILRSLAPQSQQTGAEGQSRLDALIAQNWDLLTNALNGSQQNVPPNRASPGNTGPLGPLGKVKGEPGDIFELFGPGGSWDNGQQIAQVPGHQDHVHVAAKNAMLRKLLRKADKKFDLSIREFEPYDPVERVHTDGSFHYSNQAADVSGPDMERFQRWVRRRYGIR